MTLSIESKEDPLEKHPACHNCGSPHWPGEKYCADCGQRITTGPPSFGQLFSEFFETVFNLDNRVFRTLAALPVPGKLTKAYSAGRRKPFLSPLRFFFIVTVVCLAAFSALLKQSVGDDMDESRAERHRKGYYDIFQDELAQRADSLAAISPDSNCANLVSEVSNLGQAQISHFSIGIVYLEWQGGLAFQERNFSIPVSEFVSLRPSEIADKYQIKGWFNRYQVYQMLRINDSGSDAIPILLGQTVWGILLLIPLCALALKLVFIRRKYLYVEHFIFALHVHTFIFLWLTCATLLYLFAGQNLLYWLTIGVAPLYFLFSLRRYYGQSWWKVFLKAILLYFSYVVIVGICFGASLVISIVLF
ncbi:hypothetical protein CEQ90_15510 [Lewinellaceae bacterium SD302]|nr:hypothetical protein CEQ90_15510 [Lewinellaceae bacterium SD302]